MEYTTIHGTEVSRIGLGTWALGGSEWGVVEESDAVRTCLALFEHGMNLIDTAPVYGHGRAETIVGKAVKQYGRREDFYVVTKCGLEWDVPGRPGEVIANSTPERLERELRESLARLDTSYVDLYMVHWPDTLIEMEEIAAVFLRFLQQGRIRAIGVSNFSTAQMDAFRSVAPIHANQPPYNLFERAIDAEVLPYCREHGIAVLTYSSLCRSLLAGRLRMDTVFAEGDIRRADPKFQPPRFGQYLAAVDRLDAFAQQHYGKSVLELAVRWTLDQPGISVALWGAKQPSQLAAVDGVMGWHLDERAWEAMTQIVEQTVEHPIGPEYLTPGVRGEAGFSG